MDRDGTTAPRPETPSQTAGPYVHIGLAPAAAGFRIFARELGREIAGPDVPGTRVRVEGRVIDGTGTPVRDAVIEVWQADADGVHAGHGAVADGFRGWGRVIADPGTGVWVIDTIKPGRVRARGAMVSDVAPAVRRADPARWGAGPGTPPSMAPHLTLWIVARGINLGLTTRVYFDDEAQANATDPVLTLIESERRRATLIARRQEGGDRPTYRFDIRLQGEDETVFLDV